MSLKWKIYWSSVVASVFGISWFVNWRRHRDKPWHWVLSKASFEALLTGVLAAYAPAVLTAICVLWVTDKLAKGNVWPKIVSILAGIGISAMGGVFLEGLLVIGVFAQRIITGDFLDRWRKLGEPKEPNEPSPAWSTKRAA